MSVRAFCVFNIHENVLIDSVFSKNVNVLIDHEKVTNQENTIEQRKLKALNSALNAWYILNQFLNVQEMRTFMRLQNAFNWLDLNSPCLFSAK